MDYRVIIKKSAIKELSKIPRLDATRISAAIDGFIQNPYPKGYKKLKGAANEYRIRVGDYRILYSIFEDVLVVEVIKIGHRQNVYKR